MTYPVIVYGGFLGILPKSGDVNLNFEIKDDAYGGPSSGTFKAVDLEYARGSVLKVDPLNSEWDDYKIIAANGEAVNTDGPYADSVGTATLGASGWGDLDGLQKDLPMLKFLGGNKNDTTHDNFEYTFDYGSQAWQDLAIGESISVSYTVKAWEYDHPLPGITTNDTHTINMTFTKTCFTADSLIRMADGSDKRAADVVVGDLVATADHGAQPVRWIGQTVVAGAEFTHFPSWRPVRISAGALGAGLPVREMQVSQLHRVVVRGDLARRHFDSDEVLVAARFLTAFDGVEIAQDVAHVDYVHLMFDAHEIISADGVRSESFCVGPLSRSQIGAEQLAELTSFFPALGAMVRDGRQELCRPVARGPMAEKIVAGHRAAGIALQ